MPPHPLFTDLSPAALTDAREWVQFVGAEAGMALLAEGDQTPYAIAVLSGGVELSRRGFLCGRFGAGSLVSPLHLFSGDDSRWSVSASEPSRVAILDREDYSSLLAMGHPLAHRLERAAMQELRCQLREVHGVVGRLAGHRSFAEDRTPPQQALGAILDRVLTADEASIHPFLAEPADALAASSLFAGCPREHLAALAARFRNATWTRGHFLATQGMQTDALILLTSGTMETVVVDEGQDLLHSLGHMGPGSVLGMASMLGDCPARASSIAFDEVGAMVLDRWAFDSLTRAETLEASTFRRALLATVGRQVAEAQAAVTAHRRHPRRLDLLEAQIRVDVTPEAALAM